jgi:hypothetical protein
MRELFSRSGQEMPVTKRTREVNPGHPVIARMREIHAAGKDDPRLGLYADLLYGQAVLAEGGMLTDPARVQQAAGRVDGGRAASRFVCGGFSPNHRAQRRYLYLCRSMPRTGTLMARSDITSQTAPPRRRRMRRCP